MYTSLVPGHIRLVPRLGGGGLVARGGGGGGLVAGLGRRRRVLGGRGRRQVVGLRLEAVLVGPVVDGVGDTVGADIAVLALDLVARVITVAGHRLARLGGRDAVVSLETGERLPVSNDNHDIHQNVEDEI